MSISIEEQIVRSLRGDPVTLIGKEAAIHSVSVGMNLAVSIDTLVCGIHFASDTGPFDIGYKALAVNLSDLAAMGAEPAWVTLNLSCPHLDASWLSSFTDGLSFLARRYGVTVGAIHTTCGPLTITIEICGLVPEGEALLRSTSRPDDVIYVTGTLGDAGLAFKGENVNARTAPMHSQFIAERLSRPQPRVSEGIALRGIASAAIDISDGLVGDLGHLLEASGTGATIYVQKLPLSKAMTEAVDKDQAWQLALSAGDDYELCFTVPTQNLPRLREASHRFECPITPVGVIEEQSGLRCLNRDGTVFCAGVGYRHFE